MKKKSLFVATALLISLISTQCSRPATADVDAREYILKTWGDALIVPQYATTHEQASALKEAITSLCASPPTKENLDRAQQSWEMTRTAWKRTEVFSFGPHVDFPERYGSMIDFWPVRPDSIDETIALMASGDITTTTFSTQVGAASRGLPAIEYALFTHAPDIIDPSFEEMSTHLQQPGVCDYLVAASADLDDQTLGIYHAWSSEHGDYIGRLTDPERYPDDMYMDRTEALSEIVNRMAFTLDNMRRDKLGKPVGEQTGQVSLSSMESRYSQHALEDMLATLDMIAWLVHGKPEEDLPANEEHYWLADHPRLFQRQDLIEAFDAQLATCRAQLEALMPSLATSIEDKPDKIIELIASLGALQRIIQVDIIQALSLTRSFNDSDGD